MRLPAARSILLVTAFGVSFGAAALAAPPTAYENARLSDQARIRAAASLLRKPGLRVTGTMGRAILAAHAVGRGTRGRDGVTLAGVRPDGTTNYTKAQLRAKARLLLQAGFTRKDIAKLFAAGIAGEQSGAAGSLEATFATVNEARDFVDHNTPIGNVDFDSLQERRDAMAGRIRRDIQTAIAVLEGTLAGDKAMANRALDALQDVKREVFAMDEQIFMKRQLFGR